MSEQKTKKDQPVQLTEDQLDDAKGGLLPATGMQKVTPGTTPMTTQGIIAIAPTAAAGDGSV